MVEFIEEFIIVILSIWLLLTLIYQFPSKTLELFLANYFVIGVIPKWNFFAPTPGVVNFHLLYRDVLENGTVGYWKEIEFGKKRIYVAAIWNPDKRSRKALFDLTISIAQAVEDTGNQEFIKISTPYLTILNYLSNLPRSNISVATQFTIIQTSIDQEKPISLFLSDSHRV